MQFGSVAVACWFIALALHPSTAAAAGADGKTRFGQLSVAYGGPLLLDDKPIAPEIRGNESIDILDVFHIGAKDVVLLQDNGGSGCPAQMMFATIDRTGVVTSAEFGTCATVMRVRRSKDSIVLTMPLLHGHGSRRYVFRDGVVTEDGKATK